LFNIETGQREIVGNFPACRLRRAFRRTASAGHEPAAGRQFQPVRDDLRSKTTTRLTDTPAIDTSPSYSPTAPGCASSPTVRKAADLRDARNRRSGAAHLVWRGSYSTPVWSPRGDYIAFTKQAADNSPSAS